MNLAAPPVCHHRAHARRPGRHAHRSRRRARGGGARPGARADDVLVEVHRVGVSFPDLLLSKGRVPAQARSRRSRSASTSRAPWSCGARASSRASGSPACVPYGGAAELVRGTGDVGLPAARRALVRRGRGAADELPDRALRARRARRAAGAARRCSCTARPAGSAPRPSRWPRGSARASSRSSSTEEKADVARDGRRRRGGAARRLQGRGCRADRRPRRRRRARRGRRRRVHRLAARRSAPRAGCSSSASRPARASPRSRSTGCCSTTSTSAASGGAPTRWSGPGYMQEQWRALVPMIDGRRGHAADRRDVRLRGLRTALADMDARRTLGKSVVRVREAD